MNASRIDSLRDSVPVFVEKTKAQRYTEIALDVLAGLFLVSSGVCLGLIFFSVIPTAVGLGLTVFFLCASYTMYQQSLKTFRYSPRINEMRQNLQKELDSGKPLKTVLRDWGGSEFLFQVFTLGMISKKLFFDKTLEGMQKESLKDIFAWYQELEKIQLRAALQTNIYYSIPHPSRFRGKWKQETYNLSFSEIYERYDFDLLGLYQILPQEEIDRMKAFSDALKRDPSEATRVLINSRYEHYRPR